MKADAVPGDIDRLLDRSGLSHLMLRACRLLGKRFGRDAVTGAAWTMLLELYVSKNRRAISIKALCLLSGAPIRTALRIIDGLVARKLVLRKPDARDRRQVNIELSRGAIRQMDAYFDELGMIIKRNRQGHHGPDVIRQPRL